nr:TMV resistance protein N-like [Arachis hypogaea]
MAFTYSSSFRSCKYHVFLSFRSEDTRYVFLSFKSEEYLDLSKQVIQYCAGLPLALEVLGSHLYDSMDKDIFLDIAYFFKGWFQDTVIAMLKGRGYHLEIGIATLIVRSLLTINEEGRLKIHDLVEEMGKHIIIQEFPNDPSKHSMLQNYEDIDIVLTQKKINGKFFTVIKLEN